MLKSDEVISDNQELPMPLPVMIDSEGNQIPQDEWTEYERVQYQKFMKMVLQHESRLKLESDLVPLI